MKTTEYVKKLVEIFGIPDAPEPDKLWRYLVTIKPEKIFGMSVRNPARRKMEAYEDCLVALANIRRVWKAADTTTRKKYNDLVRIVVDEFGGLK